jgi:glycosyltransferase involved in cell wall biosynthesis
MKVCILTTAFPRWETDNRAPFIYNAAQAITALGYQVRVIAMHTPGSSNHEILNGIEVFRPRYLPDHLENLQNDRGGIPSAWKTSWKSRQALIVFSIIHTISTIKYARNFDIIHANWTLSGICAWIGQPFHHKPYIVTVHGSDINQGIKYPLIRMFTKVSLEHAERILAVSNDLARTVESMGIAPERIQVIPDGVDTDIFHPSSNPRQRVVLFVGTLSEQKGIIYLLDAFSKVTHINPNLDLRLEIIGDGPSYQDLIGLTQQLGLSEKVSFLGSLPQVEVSRRMRQSMLLVLPSINEGLGVVLLEALASGTPCIGSKTGGITDIISRDVGRLVPPSDPIALRDAILEIIQNNNLWERMSSQARRVILDKYAWPKIAVSLTNIYKECVLD